jgi:hypothetical protein
MLKLLDLCVAALVLSIAVSGACPEEWERDRTYTDRSGRKLCLAHHIPLVTVRGFIIPDSASVTFIDPATNEEWRVGGCNPNRILDNSSLRRTKRISQPAEITYCRKCEAAFHAWRLQHERNFHDYDSGGSAIAGHP